MLSTYLGPSILPAPTGTCPPPPNCSAGPPSAWSGRPEATHERARTDPAGVLYGPSRARAQCESADGPVAAYPDTWRLLLGFASTHHGKPPSALDFDDLDVALVAAFLDHLERESNNSLRTRNARLAAIHLLFRYAALRHPEHLAGIGRVLAIQPKRFEQAVVGFLTEVEVEALLAAPDRTTWTGRRDRALLLVAMQTGLRISELIGLRVDDVHLGTGAHVVCHGKGHKERITPLSAVDGDAILPRSGRVIFLSG